MSLPSQIKSYNLSIFLIKEDTTRIGDILFYKEQLSNLEEFNFVIDNIQFSLFIKPLFPRNPTWADFFEPFVGSDKVGKSTSPAALLLTRSKGRIFALAFGSGRYLLHPNCFEERFGLKVALNTLNDLKLKSIDKKTFDSISSQTRTQAARESDVRDFGLDIERDLLRAITGKPSDETLGLVMSGMDALNVRLRTNLSNLSDLLGNYLNKSTEIGYKDKFPWVDQIMEVSNKSTVSLLDKILDQKFKKEEFDGIDYAVPEMVDYSITGFRHSYAARAPEFYDLELRHLIDEFDRIKSEISVEKMKSMTVHALSDKEGVAKWTPYKCLSAEVETDEKKYILSSGKWYQISSHFLAQLEADFQAIPRYDADLPKCSFIKEGDYNQQVVIDFQEYLLFDKENTILGGKNKFEFCDLYSEDNDLIHVKRYGNASVLSHLFSQGAVSAETFYESSDLRIKLNEILPTNWRITDPSSKPLRGMYQVVYAIIDPREGDLRLPFFSKVNLRQAWRRLDRLGFRVALTKITVDDKIKKLLKY